MKLTFSDPQLVATAKRRRELGLDFWVDGTMGIVRRQGRTTVIAPNGPKLSRHVIDGMCSGSSLGSALAESVKDHDLEIDGLPDDVDHASGGPLIHDLETGLWLLVYHGEWFHEGDDQNYYAFIGMAVSCDGEAFRDLGPIITSDIDRHDPARPRPVEVGPGAVAMMDGYLYVYFQDRGFTVVRRNLCVARARLADVLAAAAKGVAPTFHKYNEGTFLSPGLGGDGSDLIACEQTWICWFDVIRMVRLERLVLVFSTASMHPDGLPRWNYGICHSKDGINWSGPAPALDSPELEEVLYLTLDSGERDVHTSTSDSFDLYRTRATAEFRWDDARVERIGVTVDPGTLGQMGELSGNAEELTLRRTTDDDRPAIIELCRASLGWRAEDPNEAFFAWKHDQNPFGASPAWVAEAPDGSLAGLRVFLRWRFRQADGTTFTAVRAVDTATHPDWQGKGIFTKLTLGAIPDLRDEGVGMIFNTPNDKSRPGYLKMGWSTVGRVPAAVRPRAAGSLPTMLRSRTAAELWSEPSDLGLPAAELLADSEGVGRLLLSRGGPSTVETDRSTEYLQWRYSFGPLRYRAVPVGDRVDDGLVIVRLRRRGEALECAVVDVIVPDGVSARGALGYASRHSGADYLLRCTGTSGLLDGFVPAPQLGPVLTWRPINCPGVPDTKQLSLTLGDIELF